MKSYILIIMFALAAAGCGCAGASTGSNAPWTISALFLTSDSGVAVDFDRYFGYDGLSEHTCEATDRRTFAPDGKQEGNLDLLLNCGECIYATSLGSSYYGAPPFAYAMPNGDRVTLGFSPPSLTRTAADGSTVYQSTLLAAYDSLTSNTPIVENSQLYVAAVAGQKRSVVKLDVSQPAVEWTKVETDGTDLE